MVTATLMPGLQLRPILKVVSPYVELTVGKLSTWVRGISTLIEGVVTVHVCTATWNGRKLMVATSSPSSVKVAYIVEGTVPAVVTLTRGRDAHDLNAVIRIFVIPGSSVGPRAPWSKITPPRANTVVEPDSNTIYAGSIGV